MEYNQTLTLNLIRGHRPCIEGWENLLSGLGKTMADDEPLTIAEIYQINGFEDALWCLRALPDAKLSRHFQAWCAEQVLSIFERERPDDTRVRDQIAILRNDYASEQARATARDAARAAARDAAWGAAWDAAWAAAGAAARDAAWGAAWDAAWAAAGAAARDAAVDAAGGAAGGAAGDAAGGAAWDAAGGAAWDAQERQFRKMIGIDQ